MRKFKIVLMSIVCAIVASLFITEAFASVLVNLNVTGDIVYVADEIGADIFATYKVTGRQQEPHTYLNIVGSGTTDEDGIYQLKGSEDTYSSHTSNLGTLEIFSSNDEVEFHVFMKNTGDRNIIPSITTNSPDSDVTFSIEKYYFNISNGQTDFIAVKRSGASSVNLISQFEQETLDEDYSEFADNQSITKNDVFMAKIIMRVTDVTHDVQATSFELKISFISDVQYNNSSILSVRQENNIVSPIWEKIGPNRNLNASAIKGETNDLAVLASAYQGKNTNANLTTINSNLSYDCDDYDDQVVYRDIDLVNIDIATGEIIGKLSDINYDFEWLGGSVTLPSGTTLASGRTLETEETFTVDVYTYYPTFYARRWVVAGTSLNGSVMYTHISISDEPFAGSVEIPSSYIATSEATMFNPDGTVAHNENGIILRSYLYGWAPTTGESSTYLQSKYGFGTYTDSTVATSQAQYLLWQQNLTNAWSSFATSHPTLKTASMATGENYRAFAYQLLYLVKYANNNSQSLIGSGNVNSRNIVSGSISNTDQSYNKAAAQSISNGSGSNQSRIEAAKGGGVIGLKGTKNTTTGTTKFNNYGLAFGYNNDGGNTPLYASDFLTYNNGTKRILRDGYIGSDQYTSVCCLGKMNPWGNVGTWVCGTVTLIENSQLWCFVQTDEYNGSNYYLSNASTSGDALIANYGYTKLSYSLPKTKNLYRYCGTSEMTSDDPIKNGKITLICLPTSSSSSGSATTGLCDGYWAPNNSNSFGILLGGAAHNTTDAGIFYSPVDAPLEINRGDYGFRPMLL